MSLHNRPELKSEYGNYIGGKFVPAADGHTFDVVTIDGSVITKVPRSNAKDVNAAIDAAHAAFATWKNSSVTERSNMLLKIADIVEENHHYLAAVETLDNGKSIRETIHADIALVIDHFRYFAGVIRAEEGTVSELDATTVSVNIKEPIGVVAQIIPWNFRYSWRHGRLPALAAGNCVIVKPAEQTPAGICVFMELVGHLIPDGVLNIVHGFGPEAGKPLAQSSRVHKVAFTGETTTGRLIMQYASENLNPVTMELGGKSPNVFFKSVMDADDEFLNKAIEGAVMFALNQGEVCTCPSRILVHEDLRAIHG